MQFPVRKRSGNNKNTYLTLNVFQLSKIFKEKYPYLGSYRSSGILLNIWNFLTKFTSQPTFQHFKYRSLFPSCSWRARLFRLNNHFQPLHLQFLWGLHHTCNGDCKQDWKQSLLFTMRKHDWHMTVAMLCSIYSFRTRCRRC